MITKKFGIDFYSDGGALTLNVGEVTDSSYDNGTHTRTHDDGWTITGKIHEDYYTWVNDFDAIHPVHGKVWGTSRGMCMLIPRKAIIIFMRIINPTRGIIRISNVY